MVRRNPSLGCDVGKQPTLIHKCASHASFGRFVTKKLTHEAVAMARFFSGLLVEFAIATGYAGQQSIQQHRDGLSLFLSQS
jgi:hypothetical protein